MPRTPLVLASLAFSACGAAPPDATVPTTAMAVETEADLPACDGKHRGALYFVEDGERFVVCKEGGWDDVDLHGPRGATGSAGAAGVTGARGTTGAAAANGSLFSSSIYCSGTLSGTALVARYDAAVLNSGDVLAHASIGGAAYEQSQSEFYAAAQNGAATAVVILVYDVEGTANSGWWELALNRATLILSVTYHDTDSPGGQRVWTKPASECIANVYQ